MNSYLKDIILAIIFFIYPFFLLLGSKQLAVMGLGKDGQRKFVHMGMGLVVLFIPFFDHKWIVLIPPIIFAIVNAVDYCYGWFSEIQGEDRGNVGTILYPVSYIVLIIIFHKTPFWGFAVIGILSMAFGDAAASVLGRAIGKYTGLYYVNGETRSYAGSIAMFFVTFFIALIVLLFTAPGMGLTHRFFAELALAFLIAGIATIIEALSIKGSDNITVPVLTALFGYLLVAKIMPEILGNQSIVNQPLY